MGRAHFVNGLVRGVHHDLEQRLQMNMSHVMRAPYVKEFTCERCGTVAPKSAKRQGINGDNLRADLCIPCSGDVSKLNYTLPTKGKS